MVRVRLLLDNSVTLKSVRKNSPKKRNSQSPQKFTKASKRIHHENWSFMSTRSRPPSTESFMAANESFYNSFCLKSVSHGALECDSPRRWNIIRGSKKKEVDPPFSLCVGRFSLLQLRNSLCAQIEKNPYLILTICNRPKPYMKSKLQGIIYSRISKGFLLFEVIEY